MTTPEDLVALASLETQLDSAFDRELGLGWIPKPADVSPY
jgi:hypothetical protein